MAGKNRTASHAVEIEQRLEREPYNFHLFQALRWLENRFPGKPRIGQSKRPADEPVRLRQEAAMTFAPAPISSFRPGSENKPAVLTLRGFGLFGPNGPLPLHLTEYARERARNGDTAFTRFADKRYAWAKRLSEQFRNVLGKLPLLSVIALALSSGIAEELEWLINTDLLEIPFAQRGRATEHDALAAEIFSHPLMTGALETAVNSVVDASGPRNRDELERLLFSYMETRAANAEVVGLSVLRAVQKNASTRLMYWVLMPVSITRLQISQHSLRQHALAVLIFTMKMSAERYLMRSYHY